LQLTRTLAAIKLAVSSRANYLRLTSWDVVFDFFDAVTPRKHGAVGTTKRILFLEDRVPHHHLGSGYPRSNVIIAELLRLGHSVTLYPLTVSDEEEASVFSDISRKVEVILRQGPAGLKHFLNDRA